MKTAPPGWQPHQIVTRLDGYIAARGDRIPAAVAKLIGRAIPDLRSHSVADVRARMHARQRMYAELSKLTDE